MDLVAEDKFKKAHQALEAWKCGVREHDCFSVDKMCTLTQELSISILAAGISNLSEVSVGYSSLMYYFVEHAPSLEVDGSEAPQDPEGFKKIIRMLVAHGVNLNPEGPGYRTALHDVIHLYRHDLIEVFLACGSDPSIKAGGETALMWAAKNSSSQALRALVRYMPKDCQEAKLLESVNDYDRGLLHLAAKHGSLEVVKYAIELGLDVLAKDEKGDTPRSIARMWDNKEIVEYLSHVELAMNEKKVLEQSTKKRESTLPSEKDLTFPKKSLSRSL